MNNDAPKVRRTLQLRFTLPSGDSGQLAAMIKAAAQLGWIDGPGVALEHITAVKRAGADLILTYLAGELAEVLNG